MGIGGKKGLMRSHPSLRNYWPLIVVKEEGNIFFGDVVNGKLFMLLQITSHPVLVNNSIKLTRSHIKKKIEEKLVRKRKGINRSGDYGRFFVNVINT